MLLVKQSSIIRGNSNGQGLYVLVILAILCCDAHTVVTHAFGGELASMSAFCFNFAAANGSTNESQHGFFANTTGTDQQSETQGTFTCSPPSSQIIVGHNAWYRIHQAFEETARLNRFQAHTGHAAAGTGVATMAAIAKKSMVWSPLRLVIAMNFVVYGK